MIATDTVWFGIAVGTVPLLLHTGALLLAIWLANKRYPLKRKPEADG